MPAESTEQQAVWTLDDSYSAEAEGWDLFECSRPDHGVFQLQRFDCPEEWSRYPEPYPFEDDEAVWRHVRQRASQGSALHQKALKVLKAGNPEELARVMALGQ